MSTTRRTPDTTTTAGPTNGHAAATPTPTRQPRRGRPHVIDPRGVYTIPSATAALDLAKECLPREIRLGRLQARKRAGRYWVLGAWLLAWVSTGQAHPAWQAARDADAAATGNGKGGSSHG
jgi:hypothetical protein